MSQTLTQEITVAELSKYGVKVGDEYVNYSKQLSEKDKGVLVPGGTYTVDMYVADSGKRYINSVVGSFTTAKPKSKSLETNRATLPDNSKGVTLKTKPEPISNGLSKNEWADKDRRISRQGCIQVAVQVAGTFEEAVVLADKMLAFVNDKA